MHHPLPCALTSSWILLHKSFWNRVRPLAPMNRKVNNHHVIASIMRCIEGFSQDLVVTPTWGPPVHRKPPNRCARWRVGTSEVLRPCSGLIAQQTPSTFLNASTVSAWTLLIFRGKEKHTRADMNMFPFCLVFIIMLIFCVLLCGLKLSGLC